MKFEKTDRIPEEAYEPHDELVVDVICAFAVGVQFSEKPPESLEEWTRALRENLASYLGCEYHMINDDNLLEWQVVDRTVNTFDLLDRLQTHSQVRAAWVQDEQVHISFKAGNTKVLDVDGAIKWLKDHPPRCWSWVKQVPRSDKETWRDMCGLELNHAGPHKGESGRNEWANTKEDA